MNYIHFKLALHESHPPSMDLEIPQSHSLKLTRSAEGDDDPHDRHDHRHSNVDSSRPFSSVKEAVAIFGQRLLVLHHLDDHHEHSRQQTTSSPPPQPLAIVPAATPTSTCTTTPSTPTTSTKLLENQQRHEPDDCNIIVDDDDRDHIVDDDRDQKAIIIKEADDTHTRSRLNKLEADLEGTKAELKLLKERDHETQVALASLNAQLHLNMSKLAQSEAAAAAAAAKDHQQQQEIRRNNGDYGYLSKSSSSLRHNYKNNNITTSTSTTSSSSTTTTTLAQVLSHNDQDNKLLDDYSDYLGSKKQPDYGKFMIAKTAKKNNKKIKPIIPLVTDLFIWKKDTSSATHLHSPRRLYAFSQFYE